MLEACKHFENFSKLLSFTFALTFYPIMLFNNLLAMLSFPAKALDSSNFGYFVVAQKQGPG
jgi:hypothetical protein